jgi:trk system potassium uptake protein
MKIIISGLGAVGSYLAKMLTNFDHDIVLIDTNNDRLLNAEAHLDVLCINGNSSLMSILEDAGIDKADLLIAVTNNEEVNILTCITGKQLGAKKTIARVSSPEYLIPEEREIYNKLGVNHMIHPERIAALEIVDLIKQSSATETFEFSDGKLSLILLRIEENAPILYKSLREISKSNTSLDFRAIAIHRNKTTIIPGGKDIFYPDDLAYVITRPEGLKKLKEITGKEDYTIKDIMIFGGSKTGRRAAKELEKDFNIKLLEEDKEVCDECASFLDSTLVINADGKDISVLIEEGIKKMDAFIAVSENTEANILCCLQAKNLGVKKTIALVDNIDFIEIAQNIGIDTIINKKLIAASYIYRFTIDAEVTQIKCLNGVDADALEFIVKPNTRIIGKKLSQIKFPKGAIIGGIIRDNKGFIAVGDSIIQADDHVVVFTLPQAIKHVHKFFN